MVDWLRKSNNPNQSGGDQSNPLVKNIGKKVLALFIAIAFWLAANVQGDVERNLTIDIDYSNLPRGLVVVNRPPEKLNLRVRGPRSQLSSVSSQNIFFTIDLANVTEGMSKFEIQTDQINLPGDVQVTGLSPAEIKVDVDKLRQKEVPIKVVFDPPEVGFEILGKPEVVPNKVRIEGPEDTIKRVNSISTDVVSSKREKSTFTMEIPLKVPYPDVELVDTETAKVTIDIKEKTLEKEFKDLNINFVNFNELDFETKSSVEGELSFEGPYNIISKLNSEDIKLVVDGKKIKDGKTSKVHTLDVNVSYPHKDMLKLKHQYPKTVEIKLN